MSDDEIFDEWCAIHLITIDEINDKAFKSQLVNTTSFKLFMLSKRINEMLQEVINVFKGA
jgi:hypothetical protein